jgi:hypothetical protein
LESKVIDRSEDGTYVMLLGERFGHMKMVVAKCLRVDGLPMLFGVKAVVIKTSGNIVTVG